MRNRENLLYNEFWQVGGSIGVVSVRRYSFGRIEARVTAWEIRKREDDDM